MTAETRIEVTDRLRRENRWVKATAYREEQRVRLRDEGKSKVSARQESWDLMVRKFREDDRWAGYLALEAFVSHPVPAAMLPNFNSVARVYYRLMAICIAAHPEAIDDWSMWEGINDPPTDAERAACKAAGYPLPGYPELVPLSPEGANAMLSWALIDPLSFLDVAEATFRKAIEQIPDDDYAGPACKSELAADLQLFPSIRLVVEDSCQAARDGRWRMIERWPVDAEEAAESGHPAASVSA